MHYRPQAVVCNHDGDEFGLNDGNHISGVPFKNGQKCEEDYSADGSVQQLVNSSLSEDSFIAFRLIRHDLAICKT